MLHVTTPVNFRLVRKKEFGWGLISKLNGAFRNVATSAEAVG
jgi:hypothetical protein